MNVSGPNYHQHISDHLHNIGKLQSEIATARESTSHKILQVVSFGTYSTSKGLETTLAKELVSFNKSLKEFAKKTQNDLSQANVNSPEFQELQRDIATLKAASIVLTEFKSDLDGTIKQLVDDTAATLPKPDWDLPNLPQFEDLPPSPDWSLPSAPKWEPSERKEGPGLNLVGAHRESSLKKAAFVKEVIDTEKGFLERTDRAISLMEAMKKTFPFNLKLRRMVADYKKAKDASEKFYTELNKLSGNPVEKEAQLAKLYQSPVFANYMKHVGKASLHATPQFNAKYYDTFMTRFGDKEFNGVKGNEAWINEGINVFGQRQVKHTLLAAEMKSYPEASQNARRLMDPKSWE